MQEDGEHEDYEDEDDGWLTLTQAASDWGVSTAKVRRLINAGELTAYQSSRDKREKLVRREDLEEIFNPKPLPTRGR